MLEKLQALNQMILNSNAKIEIDDIDKLELSFKFADFDNMEEFTDSIIKIKQIDCESIIIKSSNTQPPLNSEINKTNNDDEIKKYLIHHLEKHVKISSANIIYKLTINKSQLINSNYNIKWFNNSKYFFKILYSPLINSEIISKLISCDKFNVIIFLEDDIFLKNKYLVISRIDKFINNNDELNSRFDELKEKLDMRKSNCNIEFDLGALVPDFFIYDFQDSQSIYTDEFYILLNNLVLLLFVLYVGTYSYYSEGIVSAKITGNKTIDIQYNIEYLKEKRENYNLIKEMYYLAYNSLSVENLFLLRNMIGVYLCDQCSRNPIDLLLEKSQMILDSSKENLNILTVGNVEKYFSTRYSLFEFLDKSSSDIHKQIQELIDKMNKIYLSTIATLVAVSLLYLKDRNIKVLKLSLFIYTVYLIIDAIYTFTFNKKMFGDLISSYSKKIEYFKPIIGLDHYNQIVSNKDTTKKLKIRFYSYYGTSLLIYSVIIIIGIFTFLNTEFILSILKQYIS